MLAEYQKVITTGNNNSYKFAIGLAICELSKQSITYQELAIKIAEYYYASHIKYRLKESVTTNQTPLVIQIVYKYIEDFLENPPSKLNKNQLKELANLLINVPNGIKQIPYYFYVFPCWENAKKVDGYYQYPQSGINNYFEYDEIKQTIFLNDKFLESLSNNKKLYIDITVYEWCKFLEKFNISPNLISKISPSKPQRRLKKYKNFFLENFKAQKCYICGEINAEEFSLDHCIPFDFIYADNLWNLMPVHLSCNSSKGSRIGNKNAVEELHKRNYLFFKERYENYNIVKNEIINTFNDNKKLEEHIENTIKICIDAGFKRY